MLRIGYVRLKGGRTSEDDARLRAFGCHVVRAEETGGGCPGEPAPVLSAILDFIGAGDELVVARLDQAADTARAVLSVIDRLETRGASLQVIEPQLSSKGEEGRTLRAVLEAVAAVEPAPPRLRKGPAKAEDIRALQQAGVGPVEIARRLGVSRMTVWRKLKAETMQAEAS